jgi:D-amino peptidase
MKVFISVDMEGITGITTPAEVDCTHPLYSGAQTLLMSDVNAAVEGALEGGATEILINDGHGTMKNIVLSELHSAARLISGSNKPLLQMSGVEGCDATLFVGYHARLGVDKATLNHTFWSILVDELKMNGNPVGEPEFNAVLAGAFGVPVVFLSGDSVTCDLARSFIGDQLETVSVKEALGRCSCNCLHPKTTAPMIRQGVARALQRLENASPCIPELPLTLELKFLMSHMADQAAIYPYAERMDGRTVRVVAGSVQEAYRSMLTLFALARNSL